MVKYQLTKFGQAHLQAMKKLQITSDNALKKVWMVLEQAIRYELESDSYDTGTLASSINTKLVRSGVVEVGTNLEYALAREHGRRPWTYPNFDALAAWAGRKGVIQWATAKYDDLHYKDKEIVFIIARSIKENGTNWEWSPEKSGKQTFKRVLAREKSDLILLYRQYMKHAQS